MKTGLVLDSFSSSKRAGSRENALLAQVGRIDRHQVLLTQPTINNAMAHSQVRTQRQEDPERVQQAPAADLSASGNILPEGYDREAGRRESPAPMVGAEMMPTTTSDEHRDQADDRNEIRTRRAPPTRPDWACRSPRRSRR